MKFMKNILLSALMVVIGTSMVGAVGIGAMPGATQQPNICILIDGLGYIFNVLRILCFAGAAFVLMGWAWGFMLGGEGKNVSLDDAKKKGTGMIIGFILLFSVGLLVQFMPGIMCPNLAMW